MFEKVQHFFLRPNRARHSNGGDGGRLAYEPHDGSLGMAHLAAFSRYSLQFALPDAPVAFADSPTKRWDGGGNGSL